MRHRVGRVLTAAVVLFVAALQVHRLDDADAWWHLATGRLIAGRGSVPALDPFSFTAPGAAWLNRQWLFERGLYGLWQLGGIDAVVLGTGALFVAAFACLWRLLRRRLPRWAAAIFVLVAAEAAVERFTVRPEAVTMLFLAIELLLLDRAVRWSTVAALVGLQVVWANAHALSVIGLVPLGAELAGVMAARWLPLPGGWRTASGRPPDELRRLAVATAGVLVAQCATPFGVEGAAYPLWLLTLISGADRLSFTIVEHRATTLAELSPAAARGMVALLVLAGGATVASIRRWRLSHVGCALAFVVLAWMARRNVALLGIGVAPLVASGLGRMAVRLDERLAPRRWARPIVELLLALGALVGAARVAGGGYYDAARLTRTFGLGESSLLFSAAAVATLESEAPGARVLNDDILGGFLLWRAFPPRQVFFDGRLQVYPESVYADYQAVLDDPARFAAVAARWRITAAILHHPAPGRLELARAIARLPGWRIAHLDGGAVLLVADGNAPATPAGIGGAVPAPVATPLGAALERVLAHIRTDTEAAIARYQRGRAVLTLFGRAGAAVALADFDAAHALRPADAQIAEAQRLARGLVTPAAPPP